MLGVGFSFVHPQFALKEARKMTLKAKARMKAKPFALNEVVLAEGPFKQAMELKIRLFRCCW
jgi:hypothetical protein